LALASDISDIVSNSDAVKLWRGNAEQDRRSRNDDMRLLYKKVNRYTHTHTHTHNSIKNGHIEKKGNIKYYKLYDESDKNSNIR
jgi:hypothetical protein